MTGIAVLLPVPDHFDQLLSNPCNSHDNSRWDLLRLSCLKKPAANKAFCTQAHQHCSNTTKSSFKANQQGECSAAHSIHEHAVFARDGNCGVFVLC